MNELNTRLEWFETQTTISPDSISSFLKGFHSGINSLLASRDSSREELLNTMIVTGSLLLELRNWLDSEDLHIGTSCSGSQEKTTKTTQPL